MFIVLSVIHFYWAFNGEKGINIALPTNENGKRVLNLKKIEIFIIGIGLLFFALYYFLRTRLLEIEFPELIIEYSGWVISSIFIVRAIGDFKYVGFFKKIKNTEFGKFDTKYFSCISLLIGLIGIIVELL